MAHAVILMCSKIYNVASFKISPNEAKVELGNFVNQLNATNKKNEKHKCVENGRSDFYSK